MPDDVRVRISRVCVSALLAFVAGACGGDGGALEAESRLVIKLSSSRSATSLRMRADSPHFSASAACAAAPIIASLTLPACQGADTISDQEIDKASGMANEATLSRRIDDLAADSMLGRGPGQRGDTLTVAYLEREMARIGLSPASKNGFRQPVTLFRTRATGRASFRANGLTVALDTAAIVLAATAPGDFSTLDAPVVLVGFGIIAPEHDWDDYRHIDLRGKVALILDGEPGSVSRKRFGTRGYTSPHGNVILKARHALARGAAAVIFIRLGSDAVHRARRLRLQDQELTGDVPEITPESPITLHLASSAGELLAQAAGTTLSAWRVAANDASTGPRELPLRLDASIHTEARRFVSHNLVGVIRGSDPALRNECVVYLAHWDAYGIGPAVRGDSIYNGALDDAAGVSEMLHIAEVVRALPRAPRRTMVFVATTAEERGMRGAEAYAARPVCPLPRTALAIGMDWSWTWGLTDTLVSNGIGYSTVDSLAARVATRLGKTFAPGLGEYWLLSDHAALALRGVPAWFGGLDGEVTGKPKGWALRQLALTRTHGPDDDRKPTWDLSGAVFEVKFLAELGIRAAESATRPVWTVESEFKRASEAARGEATPPIRRRQDRRAWGRVHGFPPSMARSNDPTWRPHQCTWARDSRRCRTVSRVTLRDLDDISVHQLRNAGGRVLQGAAPRPERRAR